MQDLLLRSREYYRGHSEEALQALIDAAQKVATARDQLEVARVFNEFLNLANLAEKHHRIRRYGRPHPTQAPTPFQPKLRPSPLPIPPIRRPNPSLAQPLCSNPRVP